MTPRIIIPNPTKPIKRPGILELRGYTQTDPYRCGVAAGWAAGFYLKDMDFEQFEKACDPKPEWGTSINNLLSALREQEIIVSSQKTTIKGIKKAIKANHPVLTMIDGKRNNDHWVVIYGCNSDRVFYHGRRIPAFTSVRMNWKQFRKRAYWKMFVVSVKEDIR